MKKKFIIVYTNFLEILLGIVGLASIPYFLLDIVLIIDTCYKSTTLDSIKTMYDGTYILALTYFINLAAIAISYMYCKKFIDINNIKKRNLLFLFVIALYTISIDIAYYLLLKFYLATYILEF